MKLETHEYSKYILLQILLFARLWRAWREWLHQSQNRSTIFQGNVKIYKLQITFCFDWSQITFAGHLKWNLAVRQKVEAKHPEIPGTPEHLGLPSIIYIPDCGLKMFISLELFVETKSHQISPQSRPSD